MSINKNYNQQSLETLFGEQKKLKKKELYSSIFIGFLVGVMVYGVAKNGFEFLYIFIPILLIVGIAKNSQLTKGELKEIQKAIEQKQE